MFEYKLLFKANNTTHAKNTIVSLARKGIQATCDKSLNVYLVRLATPKTEHPLMYVKGQKRQYYRA
jgi:hypothetical protein